MQKFNILIIGDEILSGKRQDKHFAFALELFKRNNLKLNSLTYLRDDRQQISDYLRQSFQEKNILFSFGGIGNTPDDHTRQAAANALNLPLDFSPAAEAILSQRFVVNPGDTLSPERKLLATFPLGCELIPNPFNQIPGFMLYEHYFVPGFPQMAHPMLEWVVQQFYQNISSKPSTERAIILSGEQAYESALLPLMQQIVDKYPLLRLFSLPSITSQGRSLELGVEGDTDQADAAMEEIISNINARAGISWQHLDV